MNKLIVILLSILVFKVSGQENVNKFRQLKDKLATPNVYRTASGAPGHQYYQQQANYEIDVVLDDNRQKITGKEVVTYINNSPDPLEYLWLQLDQNVRAKGSDTKKVKTGQISKNKDLNTLYYTLKTFGEGYYEFDAGFKLTKVKTITPNAFDSFTVNKTMMRLNLNKPLAPGDSVKFRIEWYYNINDRMEIGGRSGLEYFREEDNYLYTIAQFYPRMCVYNDVEGWQNKQFLGRGEFALPFGNFKVNITAPSDHIVAATGDLKNQKEVLTKTQISRLEKAKKTYDNPVLIVTQKEAEEIEKTKATTTKTWTFHAANVRDFAFASSRKFIWDAMAVKQDGGDDVMAMSYYPKEGNPLWEEHSTRAVAQTLRTYSKYTIPYPYPKAISVNAKQIGMEYPMICFNYGRCENDGTYSDRVKYGMITVVIHEVGHNYFPMIINSDERQWTWMDEGLNTYLQYLTEQEYQEDYPSRRGPAHKIVDYMKGDKKMISPIMTNSESIWQFGNNAYGKPATALNILRETVMGKELFDYAFKKYAQRWAFKHPTPADFFRTMEDASGVDLDWYWRGWFYTNDHVDIAIKKVIEKDKKDYKKALKELNDVQKKALKLDEDFFIYQIDFENIGGLVMPLIVEFTYEDGTKKTHYIPAEIWKLTNDEVSKVFVEKKKVKSIALDPYLETADTDISNNYYPKKVVPTKIEAYKLKEAQKKSVLERVGK